MYEMFLSIILAALGLFMMVSPESISMRAKDGKTQTIAIRQRNI